MMQLQDGLRAIRAPNPSPMTFSGTMTYVLGQTDLTVIDPGPDLPQHLDAILDALGPEQRITHILVTHSHVDHSSLAPALAAKTRAPIIAFGDSRAGRSDIMSKLHNIGGGEGIHDGFQPDITVKDGEIIQTAAGAIQAIWTPGHLGNHLCFKWQDAIFTGDHVMGWATSLVSPPDGNLTDFMTSCRKLQTIPTQVFYPGHGDPIENPMARLTDLIAHRQGREDQIKSALGHADATARELARSIYTEVAPALLPAAERNVLAHLIDLYERNIVTCQLPLTQTSKFKLIN